MSNLPKIIFTIIAVILVALIILLLLSSFNSDLNQSTNEPQNEEIPTETNNEVLDVESLAIETLQEGQGEETKDGDKLTVHYTGRLLTGETFDSSYNRDAPFTFTLGAGEVIQGWDQGLQGMKIGETRIVTIPSSLGYGTSGSGANIPPNAGLEFEIELLEIN